MIDIGNTYKVTVSGKYFFGRLVELDSSLGTYKFYDIRREYDIVVPIQQAVVEPYQEVEP